MASSTKTPKAEPAPKKEATSNVTSKAADAPKADAPKADAPKADAPKPADAPKSEAGETAGTAPKNYSRGEGQKPVTQAYKDNWNAIFGNKKKKR
jgi:pyruvate dehydrogenase E2 component (dihydrolipoamide acetyltransferase)